MWWWVWGALAALLLVAYVTWLTARVNRLHRRAETAAAALDAALVRRAAAAAVLAEGLTSPAQPPPPASPPTPAAPDLYAAARAALDAEPVDREAAENDLTLALRRLPRQVQGTVPEWSNLVTASRRVALARQVHTDVVRDALAVRRRVPVRVLSLARRHPEPGYFDVDDPGMDGHPDPCRAADQPAQDQATRR